MNKGIKVFSLISGIATIGSMVLSLVSSWADEKQMDETIEQKVQEALEAEMQKNEPTNVIGFVDTEIIEEGA